MNRLSLQRSESRATLDAADVSQLAHAFGYQHLLGVHDLGGTYNLNLLLEIPAGARILRVYRPWVTPHRLTSLQALRAALATAGFPALPPLKTPNGSAWLRYGDRLVECELYQTHDTTAESPEYIQATISLLGQLHRWLATYPIHKVVRPPVRNYATPSQLSHWLTHASARCAIRTDADAHTAYQLSLQARTLLKAIRRALSPHWQSLPRQLIHGDFGGGNLLFQDNKAVAILDFDMCGSAERLYDLAYTTYFTMVRTTGSVTPLNWPHQGIAEILEAYEDGLRAHLSSVEYAAFWPLLFLVPLYWIGEAGYLTEPVTACLNQASALQGCLQSLPLLSVSDQR
ncbi:MAG: phosphotransferase [Chloroflexi bacterium]|nr:phosphotransferase [Chloroflexota bacterium]